jgi:biotin synthase
MDEKGESIMLALAKEIIDGRRLHKEDGVERFLEADLEQLCEGADLIRKELCGDRVDLCSIINGRAGRCSEDCKFCAQSAHHSTNCDEYGFLPKERFVEDCGHAYENGVDRYSIVTAGRTMDGADFEQAQAAYAAMHEAYPSMHLCASHGLLTDENLMRLKEAGVSMYHTNVETSEAFFPQICTTHTYEDKKEEIARAKKAGLAVCSGGILGMGETWQDRYEMACEIAAFEVDSIPLNFLIPIPGTPLENNPRMTPDEITRCVAMFRYVNPTADIRMAAGRNYFEDGGRVLFASGANATLTGDMLTTVGNNTAQDRQMLHEMGFILK